DALLRQAVRGLPAPACADRVRRHRRRPRHGAARGGAPRRPRMGRGHPGRRREILLQPTQGGSMIDLYAAGTSNGMRGRIALEECGLAYNLHPIDLTKGEHKTPQFLALNPMGQIPVIVDHEGPGGKPVTLSQSSAILLYAAEK